MPSRRVSASGRRNSWPRSRKRSSLTTHLAKARGSTRRNSASHMATGAVPSSSWKNTTVVRGTVPQLKYNNIVIVSSRRYVRPRLGDRHGVRRVPNGGQDRGGEREFRHSTRFIRSQRHP